MRNQITKMIQVSTQIKGKLHFLNFGMAKLLKNLYKVVDVEDLYPQIKLFE